MYEDSFALPAWFWPVWGCVALLMIIAMWKVFTKAGQPGWASIIPIYNLYIMTKIAGKPWWWLLLLLVPLVNIVILVMLYHSISKSFGQGAGFTVGLILLGIIFWPILGFGSAKYIGPGGVPATSQEDINAMGNN